MRYFLTRILPLVFVLALNACSMMPRTNAGNNGVDSVPAAVTSRYERALDEMINGEDTRAIELFEGFVAAYPEYPGASLNLAKLQLRNDRGDAAVQVLKNCILLNPDYAPAYNQLGIIFRERGEFDRANISYLNAIEVDPNYALAYFNMGVLNDLYRQQSAVALDYYQQYRALIGVEVEDAEVDRWIRDLERRTGTERKAEVGQ